MLQSRRLWPDWQQLAHRMGWGQVVSRVRFSVVGANAGPLLASSHLASATFLAPAEYPEAEAFTSSSLSEWEVAGCRPRAPLLDGISLPIC